MDNLPPEEGPQLGHVWAGSWTNLSIPVLEGWARAGAGVQMMPFTGWV